MAQLIEPCKSNVESQDDRQNELVGGHHLGRSFHRHSFIDQFFKTDLLEHRGHS